MSVPQTIDELAAVVKEGVESAYTDVTGDDDIQPAFFTPAPTGMKPDPDCDPSAPLAGMFMPAFLVNEDRGRMAIAVAMVEFAKRMKAKVACWSCCAWTADYSEEEFERIAKAIKDGTPIHEAVTEPRLHPKRVERHMLMMASTEEVVVASAPITRHGENAAPTVGAWETKRASRNRDEGELVAMGPFMPAVMRAVDAAMQDTYDWKGTG